MRFIEALKKSFLFMVGVIGFFILIIIAAVFITFGSIYNSLFGQVLGFIILFTAIVLLVALIKWIKKS
ncbi:hypothetical protein YN1_4760 [Nanoarchaeota archaeon]